MKRSIDLTNPALPDIEDLDQPTLARHVDQGGTSLRESDKGEYQWPESGSSHSSKLKGYDEHTSTGDGPILGPFGAKVAAAMTGAVTTSLLSEFSLVE